MPKITQRVYPRVTSKGSKITFHSIMTDEKIEVFPNPVNPPKEVIPIIFLPGLMGSRLVSKNQNKDKVWFPPDSASDKAKTLAGFWSKSAALRQAELNPEYTMVDKESAPRGASGNTKMTLVPDDKDTPDSQMLYRGWGQVYSAGYIPVLEKLEQNLNLVFDVENLGSTIHRELRKDWLGVLSRQADDVYSNAVNHKFNSTEVQSAKGKAFGAQSLFRPLNESDMLRLAVGCAYPVHAIGYNWLQSNQQSAAYVKAEIENIIASYKKVKRTDSEYVKCEKVILVTHSMGGLVARLLLKLGITEQVIGISHGVMPATGAPLVYKRFRTGAAYKEAGEGKWGAGSVSWASGRIFGRDAADGTAILSYAPGPLELLPMPEYDAKLQTGLTDTHWLFVGRPNSTNPDETVYEPLGALGNSPGTIYLAKGEPQWWRMLKEQFLNPARKDLENAKQRVDKNKQEVEQLRQASSSSASASLKKELEASEEKLKQSERDYELISVAAQSTGDESKDKLNDYKRFVEAIAVVKQTHTKLSGTYHPNTYAHYEASSNTKSFARICWTYSKPVKGWMPFTGKWEYSLPADKCCEREENDSYTGEVELFARQRYQRFVMELPKDLGDGTVPACSGAAPTPYCKQIFKHDDTVMNKKSYGHADSYTAEITQDVTLYSVARMISDYKAKG